MDYLEGARVMQEMFSVYKTKDQKEQKQKIDEAMIRNLDKAKKYMMDIIMAGVEKPELTRDKNEKNAIYVEELFNDWVLAQELVKAIMEHTQGKKK